MRKELIETNKKVLKSASLFKWIVINASNSKSVIKEERLVLKPYTHKLENLLKQMKEKQ